MTIKRIATQVQAISGRVTGYVFDFTSQQWLYGESGSQELFLPQTGDLLVVTYCVGTQGRSPTLAISTPTGYTALTVQRTTATTYDTNIQTCYKVMGATPDTSITIPATGNTADAGAYVVECYRNVDTSTPMDVTATYATGSGTNNLPNAASITPSTSGAAIVALGGGAASSGGTYTGPTSPSSPTFFATINSPDTNDANVGAASYVGVWSSGAFDIGAFAGGSSNAANSWGCTTIALRPSANHREYLYKKGVAGTGSAGTVGAGGGCNIAGVSGTGSAGAVVAEGQGSSQNGTAEPIGVQGTGSVGTTSQSGAANVSITASAGAGQVGTTTQTASATKAITASAGSGLAGTTTQTANASISITASAGNGTVGNVSASAGSPATIAITAAAASGLAGTTTQTATATKAITSVAGTGLAGTTSQIAHATKAITASAGTGQVGNIVLHASAVKAITASAASGLVGSVGYSADANKAITSSAGSGLAGSVVVSATGVVAITSIAGQGLAGEVDAVGLGGSTVEILGVSGNGLAGDLALSAEVVKDISSVAGTGLAGAVGNSVSTTLSSSPGIGLGGNVGLITQATKGITSVAGTGLAGGINAGLYQSPTTDPEKLKIDLTTGQLVKSINSRLALLL